MLLNLFQTGIQNSFNGFGDFLQSILFIEHWNMYEQNTPFLTRHRRRRRHLQRGVVDELAQISTDEERK